MRCNRTHEPGTGTLKTVLTARPCALQPPARQHPPHPRTRSMTLRAGAGLHACRTLIKRRCCACLACTSRAPACSSMVCSTPSECPLSQACPQTSTHDQPREARLRLGLTHAGYRHLCFNSVKGLAQGRSCHSGCLTDSLAGSQAGRRTMQRSLRGGVEERGRVAGAPQQAAHALQPRRRSRLQLQPHLPHARRAACQSHAAPSAAASPAAACQADALSASRNSHLVCLHRLTLCNTASTLLKGGDGGY